MNFDLLGVTLITALWKASQKVKVTIPQNLRCQYCFGGIWSALKEANHYGLVYITQLQRFLTINAV